MNLYQTRVAFVERTGRDDLVVDTIDYADSGANFFIQAGQRLLDMLQPTRKDLGRFVKNIGVNQSSLFMKYVRAVDSVYLKESGEGRTYLERKTYSWLIEEYGDDFGEKAKGTATFTGQPTDGDTLVVGTTPYTFRTTPSALYDVAIASTLSETIDNLVATINTATGMGAITPTAEAYKISSTTCLVEYRLVGVGGNSVAFTTTSGAITLDGGGVLGGTLAGRVNQISTGAPIYFSPIHASPHPQLSLSNIGSFDTHHLMFGLDRFHQDGIIFMPPADGVYTMTIFGLFFSKMEDDVDISYHSELFPELLLAASAYSLEVFYRNTQGANDWLTAIQRGLTGMDHDLVREEMAQATNTLRG